MFSIQKLAVTDVTLMNQQPVNGEIQLSINHSVKGIPEQSQYECNTSIVVCPKGESMEDTKFKVYININSLFDAAESTDFNEASQKTFEIIYPHLRGVTATLTASSLLPPLYLPVSLPQAAVNQIVSQADEKKPS